MIDCLHSGSSLIEPSLSVILRFRAKKIRFVADIEKAFLQIYLKPEHRDFVLFWYINENDITSENIIIVFVVLVLFGVMSSPFLLRSKHQQDKQL